MVAKSGLQPDEGLWFTNRWDHCLIKLTSLFVTPPSGPKLLHPSLSLFACEVNTAARPRPTSPSLFTVGVSTQRFKICPFIWAAQAGKWKGCQSLEPWESGWLNRQCQNEREGTERANTLHTVIDFFCPWAMSESREKTVLVGQWSSRLYANMIWGALCKNHSGLH